jgi:hypothetical protein
MKTLPALIALVLTPLHALSACVPDCFIGRWKSDEALTLQDMRRHPEVTEKAKALFDNKFFGRLILVNGPSYGGGYLEGRQSPADLSFEKYDIAERGANWVTFRNRTLGVVQLQRWVCEDNRIYTVVSRWEFREYFSPLP